MTTLGIIIILLLLLVLLPILLKIRSEQKRNIQCLNEATEAIERFNSNIANIEVMINNNFKDMFGKTNVIDSRQISIKDVIEVLGSTMENYQTKVINAINASNRITNNRYKGRNSGKQGNNPPKQK